MDNLSKIGIALLMALVLDVAYYYVTGDLALANALGGVLVAGLYIWAFAGAIVWGLTHA